jgi:hypothetical protein
VQHMKQKPTQKTPHIKFLTVQELERLNTNRLLSVLKSVRAVEQNEKKYGLLQVDVAKYANNGCLEKNHIKNM